MITARMSHGGVAVYDSETGCLLRWLMMSSSVPTQVLAEGGRATVRFADGKASVFNLESGKLESCLRAPAEDSGR
jgi:hypothetical protein